VVGGYQNLGQPVDQPHILTSLLRARHTGNPFVLNGNSYPTEDGTPIRDYIHVLDVCHAIISRLRTNNSYYNTTEYFNLGTGKGISNLQLFHIFKNLLARDLEVEFTSVRPGDPAYLVADISKYFPWTPIHSDISSIMTSAAKAFEYNVRLS
jgi:UDP-glucose 4-epimerase